DEGKVRGVLLAEDCLVKFDGNILATEVNNCTFELNGTANLGPANVPTSARYNTFTDGSNIQINNESVVEYNQFCPDCLVSINPLAGGFDPDDIDEVHVNYNTFTKVGDDVGFISNSQADTIDGTLNYWGDCEGPGSGVSFSKVRTKPYLRVAWPETSYWLDITADKDEIIANDQDEVVFNLHFYNVVTAADSAGATVDYVIRIVGDTLAAGTLTMDANGRAELRVKVPFEYRNALALETYFTSIQCIDERFIINVSEQEGADLELFQSDVIQSVKSSQDFIAEKGFAVVTTISASEPVNTPFKVNVLVGANRYEEFAVIEKSNITVPFLFEEFDTLLTMPTTAPKQLVFFIQDETIQPGSLGVRVIVDPPEIGLPQGRILEGNETNNESSVPVTFTSVNWGNNGAENAQVHVQVLGEHSGQPLQKSALWADTAKTFIEKTWPMKSGQMMFNASPNITDYTWLEEDSLVQETWQRYFMNVYRQTRMANPAFDRYVFAVPANYFETRFNKNHFNHKNSQTLAWSGIYDLAVASTGSYKHLVHTLGHTYHLRRGDFAPNDPEQQEQYYAVLPGNRIQNGFDHIERRMYQDGLQNLGGRFMASHCFMGGSQLDVFGNPYFLWISGVEYDNLGEQMLGNESGTPTVPKAMLVAGSVDSTNFDFEFVPWSRLDNATPSAMVNDTYAEYIFKALDGSDNVLGTYNYTPTFVALGLDETNPAENPQMEREYFAFVMPAPDGTAKIVVETATGTPVTERVISANAPVIDIVPADNAAILPDDVTLSWSATDADGDTEFWYTVYYREPGGDWQLIQFEDPNMSHLLGTLAEQNGYQVRVIASDGVNTSEKTHTFHVSTNDAEDLSSPSSFALYQNYPNPFNPSTAISFTIPRSGFVALDVYDQLGRKVRTLVNERVATGTHTVNFSADGLTSGQYTAVMRFADGMKTISMTLAK
ncbi:MAG: hypothetical protein CL946_10100, partial [Ectothiorhodospiraceae bacterium]|nr:hypothetical protein [Ectothiorhodospiraceae bacterium]